MTFLNKFITYFIFTVGTYIKIVSLNYWGLSVNHSVCPSFSLLLSPLLSITSLLWKVCPYLQNFLCIKCIFEERLECYNIFIHYSNSIKCVIFFFFFNILWPTIAATGTGVDILMNDISTYIWRKWARKGNADNKSGLCYLIWWPCYTGPNGIRPKRIFTGIYWMA